MRRGKIGYGYFSNYEGQIKFPLLIIFISTLYLTAAYSPCYILYKDTELDLCQIPGEQFKNMYFLGRPQRNRISEPHNMRLFGETHLKVFSSSWVPFSWLCIFCLLLAKQLSKKREKEKKRERLGYIVH